MRTECHVKGHGEAREDEEEEGREEGKVDEGRREGIEEKVQLRDEREVLKGLDEEERAVDGAQVVHLLQLEHERL